MASFVRKARSRGCAALRRGVAQRSRGIDSQEARKKGADQGRAALHLSRQSGDSARCGAQRRTSWASRRVRYSMWPSTKPTLPRAFVLDSSGMYPGFHFSPPWARASWRAESSSFHIFLPLVSTMNVGSHASRDRSTTSKATIRGGKKPAEVPAEPVDARRRGEFCCNDRNVW